MNVMTKYKVAVLTLKKSDGLDQEIPLKMNHQHNREANQKLQRSGSTESLER